MKMTLDMAKPSSNVDAAMANSLTSKQDTIPRTGEVIETNEMHLKKNFNLFSTLGVTFSITAVPLAIGGYLNLVVGLGGAPAYFWCFVVAAVMQLIVCLSIAELASGLPHPAGK